MIGNIAYKSVSFTAIKEKDYPVKKDIKLDREKSIALLGPLSETAPETKLYRDLAYGIAYDMAKKGFNIITGGGCAGIMNASNKGAHDADPTNSKSWAIDVIPWINRPAEKIYNVLKQAKTGPQRTEMIADNSNYVVLFNGGPGTWQEWGVLMERMFYGKKEKGDKIPEKVFIIDYNPLVEIMRNVLKKKPNFSEHIKFVKIKDCKTKLYKHKACSEQADKNPDIKNAKEIKKAKQDYEQSLNVIKESIINEITKDQKNLNLVA